MTTSLNFKITKKIAFIFLHDLYNKSSQEGSAILASAISLNQNIGVFFINEGILIPLKKKKPKKILYNKKLISHFLLLNFYNIKKIFFYLNSKKKKKINSKDTLIKGNWINHFKLNKIINQYNTILTF